MPNWCENIFEISGPKEKIKALYEESSRKTSDSSVDDADTQLLQSMCPMPDELNGTTSPSDGPNWYDWRITNWGTKWEVSVDDLEYEEEGDDTATLTGNFESAWSPPIEAFRFYAENNPDVSVSLHYCEEVPQYAGYFFFSDGEEDSEQFDLEDETAESVMDLVGAELDDMFCISDRLSTGDDEDE
jgi:hypothetical protein